ncbi:MAG: GNAT family N-acetyltransferase [Planctomycetota bacterium]|nr:GNAT family N-acetyltransferase [Planctomycetaceae bacterium]MDQ3330040.1 GNAT family N-acetyltransferase [Planctomycetota bacterium]
MSIHRAETDEQIAACFAVMRQLRPQLTTAEFVPWVQAQTSAGYRLVYCEADGQAVSVAGYRVIENLAWGRFLYVDDLVTDEHHRSQGQGDRLFEWLVAEAKQLGCGELHLDSGVQRFAAHRFYLRHRMDITSHHFAMKLG